MWPPLTLIEAPVRTETTRCLLGVRIERRAYAQPNGSKSDPWRGAGGSTLVASTRGQTETRASACSGVPEPKTLGMPKWRLARII
jgi:hypothetical protein